MSAEVEADQGWCSGAFIFDVSEGNSDGVDLAGCKAAAGFEWPGNFWKGNGTARLFIDETASADQRREMEAIFGGQKGGPLGDVLPAVVAKVLPTEFTKIDIKWSEGASVTIGDVASLTLEPLKDQAGNTTKVQGALAMGAFQFETMDIANSKGSRWTDADQRAWDGDSGTLHAFSWSG